jgi:hypothetical protein
LKIFFHIYHGRCLIICVLFYHAEAVFAQTKPIVASVLDGYNVCIFAYGQTGTGKTFTMEGTPEHHGVNYRTLEELFRISEDRQGTMKYELHVSMLEVYNEKIKDLLAGNPSEATKVSLFFCFSYDYDIIYLHKFSLHCFNEGRYEATHSFLGL